MLPERRVERTHLRGAVDVIPAPRVLHWSAARVPFPHFQPPSDHLLSISALLILVRTSVRLRLVPPSVPLPDRLFATALVQLFDVALSHPHMPSSLHRSPELRKHPGLAPDHRQRLHNFAEPFFATWLVGRPLPPPEKTTCGPKSAPSHYPGTLPDSKLRCCTGNPPPDASSPRPSQTRGITVRPIPVASAARRTEQNSRSTSPVVRSSCSTGPPRDVARLRRRSDGALRRPRGGLLFSSYSSLRPLRPLPRPIRPRSPPHHRSPSPPPPHHHPHPPHPPPHSPPLPVLPPPGPPLPGPPPPLALPPFPLPPSPHHPLLCPPRTSAPLHDEDGLKKVPFVLASLHGDSPSLMSVFLCDVQAGGTPPPLETTFPRYECSLSPRFVLLQSLSVQAAGCDFLHQ
eukprot:360537-Rhodomonas_salina.2